MTQEYLLPKQTRSFNDWHSQSIWFILCSVNWKRIDCCQRIKYITEISKKSQSIDGKIQVKKSTVWNDFEWNSNCFNFTQHGINIHLTVELKACFETFTTTEIHCAMSYIEQPINFWFGKRTSNSLSRNYVRVSEWKSCRCAQILKSFIQHLLQSNNNSGKNIGFLWKTRTEIQRWMYIRYIVYKRFASIQWNHTVGSGCQFCLSYFE